MQQLSPQLEVELKNSLKEKKYNDKQLMDWMRYFKEAFEKNNDKEKSISIANIRFNHKYSFNKRYGINTLKMDYIQRKIDKVNK